MSKVKPVKIQCPGVATQVSKLLKENPSEVIGAILNEAFWIPELKTSLTYSRLGDDDDGLPGRRQQRQPYANSPQR